MNKLVMSLMALLVCAVSFAQTESKTVKWPDGTDHEVYPVAVFRAQIDSVTVRSFSFGTYKDFDIYAVDFGDGNLVLTDTIGRTTSTATATAVSGVATGTGIITVYAENDSIWYFSTSAGMSKTSSIDSLDIKGLKNVQQMSLGAMAVDTIDLAGLDSLRTFTAANGNLKTIDFSGKKTLATINVSGNQLASINVTGCEKLDGLTIYDNAIEGELDLTTCPALTGLYAYNNKISAVKFAEGATFKTLNLQKNALTAIDMPAITGSSSMVYLNDNELTELDVPTSVATFDAKNNKIARISLVDCTKTCNIENNCLTIATLPKKPAGLNTATKIKKFTYAPQAAFETVKAVAKNQVVDLSAQLTAEGELEEGTATTTYTLINEAGDTLALGTDYEVAEEGKFKILAENLGRVHFAMENAAFPKAIAANAFVTAEVPVVKPLITMTVDVDGTTERAFSFGSYKASDYYMVDFGDGELVTTEEIGATTSTATKTAASAVAKGEGKITIYAENDSIWYFSTSAGMSKTSSITSIDVTGLKNAHQVSLGAAALESLDVTPLDSVRTFTAANGALKTIDFSGKKTLNTINVSGNQLASINVTGCEKLDGLTIYDNAIEGELDLSTCPALTGLYAYNNKISSVKFAEGATFKTLNLQKNALTAIDMPAITGSSSMVYLNDNELTELDVPTSVATFDAKNNKIARISLVDCTKTCNIENNCLTIATLPKKPAGLNTATKIKKFTYAPQAAMEVAESFDGDAELDLTDQLIAEGELEEGTDSTVFAMITNAGDTLKVGTDYEVVEPGKFKFLVAQESPVHVAMHNAAFPKFTEAVPFVTTEFTVNVVDVIENTAVETENDVFYNIQGLPVVAPVTRGVYIKNGNKVTL